MNDAIKVGFCVAYDWQLLRKSLPMIYHLADLICLSIDKDRISWSGNSFEFDEISFRRLVEEIDVQNKILIYEDNFYLPSLTPMQNEVRQRSLLAKHMKDGGWFIQLDSDEYFIAFEKFVGYLKSLTLNKIAKVNVCCAWITLFKKVPRGFLYVNPKHAKKLEFIQVATRAPNYEYGRRNGNFNIHTNFRLLHQSWARSEQEVKNKIDNWGHSRDFDSHSYFKFWQSLNAENYQEAKNFHFLIPEIWPALEFAEGEDVLSVIDEPNLMRFPRLTTMDRFFKNSKFFSRLRVLRRMVSKFFF
jgi:hypothetical protein